MPTLTESRPPARHQQHSYKMNPPLRLGCEARWSINGQAVSVGSAVGGLSVKGFGASGEMTVEVEGDAVDTTVSVMIACPGATAETLGPMAVGSGAWSSVPAPPGPPGISLTPITVDLTNWSWWDRFGGFCPKSLKIGNAQCQCNMTPEYEGLWPFYYKIKCTFNCPLRVTVVTWTLSFGFITSGPN